jgi:hypothetical protein
MISTIFDRGGEGQKSFWRSAEPMTMPADAPVVPETIVENFAPARHKSDDPSLE